MGGSAGERRRGIEFIALPSQKKFLESTARFKGFSGPIGSGKSQVLCQEALRLSYQNPGRTGLIGAPTYPMLRDATLAALIEVLDRNKIPYELNRSENFLVLTETRSRILLRAVEEFERLRGSNLAWFGLDELTYFPHNGLGGDFSGMPFYDAWTQGESESRYEHAMEVFYDNDADPEAFPDEVEFLGSLIGEYTDAIMTHVRVTHPTARFEVLYPFDVNYTAFNKLINYPASVWTPAVLECLKTEGLGFTFTKRLKQSEEGMRMGEALGFLATQRSHLAGLGDATAPWLKEMRIAAGMGFESAVGFALDQFCLIGYKLPLPLSGRRGTRMRG